MTDPIEVWAVTDEGGLVSMSPENGKWLMVAPEHMSVMAVLILDSREARVQPLDGTKLATLARGDTLALTITLTIKRRP